MSRNAQAQRRGFAWLESLLGVSLVALAAQLAWPSCVDWWNQPRPGAQVAANIAGLNCLVYLPPAYHAAKEPWPLLVYLHGSGGRGNDPTKLLDVGLPLIIEQGKAPEAMVVSPQCPPSMSWEPTFLLPLIDQIVTDYRIDRVVVTGYSMGGYGTWKLAQAAPERFAAVAPLCGGGDPRAADNLVDLPIWALHGAKDDVVSPARSEEMVAAANAAGGNAKLTLYPDAGHGICYSTYDDPALFQWLLSQPARPLP